MGFNGAAGAAFIATQSAQGQNTVGAMSDALRSRDFARALSLRQAALAVDPNDQQAVYQLIVALRKTGDKDEIPGLLKRLVALRAESKTKDQAKRYRLYEGKPSGNADGQTAQ